jgi:hypothetical protein
VRRGTAVLLVGLLALVAGCSRTKTLDSDQLDQKIAAEIQANLRENVSVSCPDGVEVAAGGTFECDATSVGGSSMKIQVTQTDDQGNVTFKVVGAG